MIALIERDVRLSTTEADPILPINRLSDGRFVAPTSGRVEIAFWDPSGKMIHRAGRRGVGPGEFQTITALYVDMHDTTYVYDGSSQLEVFDPNGTYVRTIGGAVLAHYNSVAMLDRGDFLAGSPNTTATGFYFSVIDGNTGTVTRSFAEAADPIQRGNPADTRLIAYRGGPRFWAVSPSRYVLELWDTAGIPVATLHRKVAWFTDRSADDAGPPNTQTSIISIVLDDDDNLWVSILVPDRAGMNEDQPSTEFALRVEVIDGNSGALIATELFENPYDFMPQLYPDGVGLKLRIDSLGIFDMTVSEYKLVDATRGQ